jgi:hypothetical protein
MKKNELFINGCHPSFGIWILIFDIFDGLTEPFATYIRPALHPIALRRP